MSKKAYEIVVDNLLEKMEKGGISWKKGWTNKRPVNLRGTFYRGINRFILNNSPYKSNVWATFNQIKEAGGQVKKGEKSTEIVFWKMIKFHQVENEEITEKTLPYLRFYNVFNIEQTTLEIENNEIKFEEPQGIIDEYLKNEGINILYNEKTAYYSSLRDIIGLPFKEAFESKNKYYATILHEIGHSTGHKKRLDRKLGNKFGNEDYSKEELIAELTASFLMNDLGLTQEETEENHAAYLKNWLRVLKNDKKMIIYASQQAEKAVDYIYNSIKSIEKTA